MLELDLEQALFHKLLNEKWFVVSGVAQAERTLEVLVLDHLHGSVVAPDLATVLQLQGEIGERLLEAQDELVPFVVTTAATGEKDDYGPDGKRENDDADEIGAADEI